MESNYYSKLGHLFEEAEKSILKSMKDYLIPSQRLSEVFSYFSDSVLKQIATGYCESLLQSREMLLLALEQLKESYGAIALDLPEISIPEETIRSAREAVQYLTEEENNIEQQIAIQQVVANPKKKLSLKDAIAILNILITVFFGIMQLLPNKQLERIIEQKDAQISIEKSESEQTKQLIDALNTIGNGIYCLADEIDLLREEIKSAHDLPEVQGETNPKDPQEKNSDE